ncbi:MAG TPA: rod shape-determining protein [Bryobacteraceae bacterium]|jgi:rod shape-determining protein MreB|nr:rod shape-determining protein [Bryobacteraceae bacterium]
MKARSLTRLFSSDLAVDLGTANTLVYATGKGIVVNEPSMVALSIKTGDVVAVGTEAKRMLGRTPRDLVAVRPLRDGVIADFKAAERMLSYFIQKAHKRKVLVCPRIVIGVPSGTTEVEKRAVLDAAYQAKASEVYLVEQPFVAALGAGLPVSEPAANMVVDIGGGTSDIGVLSLSGTVYSQSIRVAGNEMDQAITDHLKREHGLLIGERTAETIKIELGSAEALDREATLEVKGRDVVSGLPKAVTVTDSEIRRALRDCVQVIVDAVRASLERIPPELSGDLTERGIVLTGGGAMLKNLDTRLHAETGLPMSMAADPLLSVVNGTGQMLSDFKLLRRISVN